MHITDDGTPLSNSSVVSLHFGDNGGDTCGLASVVVSSRHHCVVSSLPLTIAWVETLAGYAVRGDGGELRCYCLGGVVGEYKCPWVMEQRRRVVGLNHGVMLPRLQCLGCC